MTKDKMPPSVWVLISAAFVIAMGFGLIAPVLPLFAQDMAAAVFPDAEITATTAVVSAFAVFRLLWASPAGSLVSRVGEKPIYIAGVLVVSISTALTAFAQNYWQLLVFRSLGGVGSVMFTVAAMGLLIKISPRHMRGRISALYGAMFLIGNMVGPLAGGALAELGIQVPFLSYAVALLIAAVVMGLLMPSTSPGRMGNRTTLPPMTLREALSDRAYRANLPGLFAHGWSNFGVRVSVLPLFVAYAVSQDAWVAGAAMATFAVGNAAALPFSSRFADRGGRKPMIMWGALIAGVFTASLGIASGHLGVFLVCLLAGVGTGMFNPAAQAVVADIVGNERTAGKVIASTQMVTDVGSIIGPLLAGLIVDAAGFGPAWLISGLILIVGALAWIGTPDTIHRTRD